MPQLRQSVKMFIIFMASCIYALPLLSQTIMKSVRSLSPLPASTSSSNIEPLFVGDEVSNIGFTMINHPIRKTWLSDFHNKLVILDFWATWCGTCISNFPKLEKLQQRFSNELQIILVSSFMAGDSEDKVKEFLLKKHQTDENVLSLPIAINDTIAGKLFPHSAVPHCVWIGLDGQVKAITSSSELTEQNINRILTERNVHLPIKKDFNNEKVLNLLDTLSTRDIDYYSIFLKGRISDLGEYNWPVKSGDIMRGRVMRNIPLLDMFKMAFNILSGETQSNKRILLDISDSSSLIFNPQRTDRDKWYHDNVYTYDVIVPEEKASNLGQVMLQDLNRYSNFYGRIEKKKIKSLFLVRTSQKDKLKSSGGKQENNLYDEENPHLRNLPVSELINFLNSGNSKFNILFKDDTHYKGNIDIRLPVELKSIKELRDTLMQYDLDLREGFQETVMLVISKK